MIKLIKVFLFLWDSVFPEKWAGYVITIFLDKKYKFRKKEKWSRKFALGKLCKKKKNRKLRIDINYLYYLLLLIINYLGVQFVRLTLLLASSAGGRDQDFLPRHFPLLYFLLSTSFHSAKLNLADWKAKLISESERERREWNVSYTTKTRQRLNIRRSFFTIRQRCSVLFSKNAKSAD